MNWYPYILIMIWLNAVFGFWAGWMIGTPQWKAAFIISALHALLIMISALLAEGIVWLWRKVTR